MARYKTIKKKREYIYDDMEEFRSYRNEKVHDDWRKAPEGSWILTDDDQVCRILKRGTLGKGEYLRTVLGTYRPDRELLMTGDPVKNIYSFTSSMYPDEFISKKPRISHREKVFAYRVANGEHPTDVYLNLYRTEDRGYAKIRAMKLMRTERIMGVIAKEIRHALESIGIDEHYLLAEAKSVIEGEEVKDGDKLRALELLMKITDMFPKPTKTESIAVFQGFTSEQLNQLGGSEVEMLTDGQSE